MNGPITQFVVVVSTDFHLLQTFSITRRINERGGRAASAADRQHLNTLSAAPRASEDYGSNKVFGFLYCYVGNLCRGHVEAGSVPR